MKHLTLDEKTLTELESFSTVEDMNESIYTYLQDEQLSHRDRAILKVIGRYACKYKGVCFLRKQKIAEEAGFKSRRTAIRACHQLEALGMIKQYESRRQHGDQRQTANLIIIQPLEEASPALPSQIEKNKPQSHRPVTPSSHSHKQTYKPSANIQEETYKETEAMVKRGLRQSIPKAFYEAFAPFFDGYSLFDIYGLLLRAKAKIDRHIILEDHAEAYIDAFYNVIRLYKQGKIKHLKGYLFVAWERLSAEISRQLYDQLLPYLQK